MTWGEGYEEEGHDNRHELTDGGWRPFLLNS
jgi:hypothetical protein